MDTTFVCFLSIMLYLFSCVVAAASLSNSSMHYHTDSEIFAVAIWWPIYVVKFLLKSLWQAISKW